MPSYLSSSAPSVWLSFRPLQLYYIFCSIFCRSSDLVFFPDSFWSLLKLIVTGSLVFAGRPVSLHRISSTEPAGFNLLSLVQHTLVSMLLLLFLVSGFVPLVQGLILFATFRFVAVMLIRYWILLLSTSVFSAAFIFSSYSPVLYFPDSGWFLRFLCRRIPRSFMRCPSTLCFRAICL